MTNKKTLVITGGSSGIGKATARLFAQRGYQVFELSRSGQSEEGIEHIFCDITQEDTVEAAIEQVKKLTATIDLLISNAGFGISGAIEFTQTDEAKRQFDVNFFGTLNVLKAVLPQMREQGFGRIICTSSVAAVFSIPYQSFYSASKAAINSLVLALANEVRQFGIHVSALMPGDVATGFTDARNKNLAGSNVYQGMNKAVAAMEKDEKDGMTPMQMAEDFWRIAQAKCPAPLYVGGSKYKVFCILANILPTRTFNWIVGKLY